MILGFGGTIASALPPPQKQYYIELVRHKKFKCH